MEKSLNDSNEVTKKEPSNFKYMRDNHYTLYMIFLVSLVLLSCFIVIAEFLVLMDLNWDE